MFGMESGEQTPMKVESNLGLGGPQTPSSAGKKSPSNRRSKGGQQAAEQRTLNIAVGLLYQ